MANVEARLVKLNKSEATFAFDEELDLVKLRKKASGHVTVDVDWLDGRSITHKQRGKIFGLIRDISDYTGYTADYIESLLKSYHKLILGIDSFSLARDKCSVDGASRFIETIIQFCFDNEIPFMHQEWHIEPTYHKILFMYLMNRKCMVTGKPNADICHVEAVGTGRNRDKIDHSEHRFLSLSREYHIIQHSMGVNAFMEKYHLVPIKLNVEQLQELGVMK